MNLKEQFNVSWPFIVVGVIFILLVIFSTSGLYNANNILLGTVHILLAVTVTFTGIKASKIFQKKGRHGTCIRLIYAAGFLSGLWLYEGIKLLF
jgi:hypothetical protein